MRPIYVTLSLLAIIGAVNCGCLAKTRVGQAFRCIVEENPESDGFLQELCKNLISIADLSIVAEYKGSLLSHRTLGDYCSAGPIGRLSWVRNKDIYEQLLNSNDVDIVSDMKPCWLIKNFHASSGI